MKKQIIFTILLIMLALILALASSVLATNTEIDTMTTPDSMLNNTFTQENNEQLPGVTLPQNEEEGIDEVNQKLQELASNRAKSNQGAIITAVVAITIVLIAGMVMWWYRTNY